jgi:hypothetical protein
MLIFTIFYFIFKIVAFIIIIYGCQYTWDIIKDTYTKPKTKYLVNSQLKKYKEMFGDTAINLVPEVVTPNILFQTEEDKKQMSDDLSQFISTHTNEFV